MRKKVYSASITPLAEDRELDVEGLGRIFERNIRHGVDGIFILGSMGEWACFDSAFRDRLVAESVRAVAGRAELLVGITDVSTEAALENLRRAAEYAFDSFVFMLPKADVADPVRDVCRVLDAADRPVYYYHCPPNNGINLSLAQFEAILSHPNLKGIKNSASNMWLRRELLLLKAERGFGAALGLGSAFFPRLFARPTSRLKLNHYPPQDKPDNVNDIGVVPHADSGGFTILWQDDNGGLEVESKSGEWVGAPPIPGTFVVNIGNLMQIWSNGRYSSTPHRVINRAGVDRYSIPLFVNPGADAPIAPVVDVARPDPAPLTYGAYQKAEWRRIFPIARIPA